MPLPRTVTERFVHLLLRSALGVTVECHTLKIFNNDVHFAYRITASLKL